MSYSNTAWIADDDKSIRWVLEKALNQAGIETRSFENGDALLAQLESGGPDAVISDIRMPGIDGLKLLSRISDIHPGLPVIITTAHSDLDSAVASYQGGAFEYLPKPFDIDKLVSVVKRGLETPRTGDDFTREEAEEALPLIGRSPVMQDIYRTLARLMSSDLTVMINGESGTGKELVARALHDYGKRKDAPFIAINMAAIPKELIESELFGHEKGAFTGAVSAKPGLFDPFSTV